MDNVKDVSARIRDARKDSEEAMASREARWAGLEEQLDQLASSASTWDTTVDDGLQITLELTLTVKQGPKPKKNE